MPLNSTATIQFSHLHSHTQYSLLDGAAGIRKMLAKAAEDEASCCNRTFREDVLDAYCFSNLEEVRAIAEDWKKDYNQNHPHQSLGRKSPLKYAKLVLGVPSRTSFQLNY